MRPEVATARASVQFVVTPDKTAILDNKEIHAVCSTFWLVYYAEVAARRAIEPFFQDDENAVGVMVSIKHLAMAAVGATIIVEAVVSEVRGNRIRCTISALATNKNTLLAEGIQDQLVMRTEVLASKVAAAAR